MAPMRLPFIQPAAAALCLLGLLLTHCGGGDEPPTDEELLEQFVKDVTGVVDGPMMTRSLRYVALAEVPLDVSVPGMQGVYREDGAEKLTKRYRTEMRRRFGGSEIKVRSSKITLEGTGAKVMMRLTTAQGPLRAQCELQKIATGWKVSKVHVEPGL